MTPLYSKSEFALQQSGTFPYISNMSRYISVDCLVKLSGSQWTASKHQTSRLSPYVSYGFLSASPSWSASPALQNGKLLPSLNMKHPQIPNINNLLIFFMLLWLLCFFCCCSSHLITSHSPSFHSTYHQGFPVLLPSRCALYNVVFIDVSVAKDARFTFIWGASVQHYAACKCASSPSPSSQPT